MSAKSKPDDVEPTTEADTKLGADVSFPFDRMTVEQFRKRFALARWSDARKEWFVPGAAASRRFTRWLDCRDCHRRSRVSWMSIRCIG